MAFKKDAKSVFFLAVLLGAMEVQPADSRMLVLSIQLPPSDVVMAVQKDLDQQKSDQKIQKIGSLSPDKFAKKMMKGLMPTDLIPKTTSGIMALYAGYVTYSDKMGMITFPLRHEGKRVEVVATPLMNMDRLYKETYSGVFISQKTLVSSGISDSMPPQKFVFSQVDQSVPEKTTAAAEPKVDDKKTPTEGGVGLGAWKLERSTVPFDTQIPTETVILLVNPKNLFVPQGTFYSMVKPHIVLPDVYLIGKKFNDEVLLNNQKNMRYFEEIVVENGTVVQKEKSMEIRQ
jgi:hypothetical protein